MQKVCEAMQSLRNVLRANHGVEIACKGSFRLIFSLLNLQEEPKLQQLVLEVIAAVCGNRDCVADIADSSVLVYLFFALQTLVSGRLTALECLHAMVSNSKIVVEALNKGGLIYLLDLFCNSTNGPVREATAALFGKMLADKLNGPRVRIVLSKFLPLIFTDAMRDNPEASVTMFEGGHENPELIWNDESRSKVASVVAELRTQLYASQQKDPTVTWRLPDDFAVVYEELAGEVVVGGVFLRLLIKQPTWSFRRPKEFLVAILEKHTQLANKSSLDGSSAKALQTVTDALVAFLNAQPELANQVPSLGLINKLIMAMDRDHPQVQASCLRVLNELASSQACVACLAGQPCVSQIKNAMKGTEKSALPAACELVSKMYEANHTFLVTQALEYGLPQFLLDLLNEGLEVENPSSCKALIVKALKAMTRDLSRGADVVAVLDKCPWWPAYRDQRHDLFITNGPTVAGFLTAGPAAAVATAGYLMAPSTVNLAASSVPPPMSEDQADQSRRSLHPDL